MSRARLASLAAVLFALAAIINGVVWFSTHQAVNIAIGAAFAGAAVAWFAVSAKYKREA